MGNEKKLRNQQFHDNILNNFSINEIIFILKRFNNPQPTNPFYLPSAQSPLHTFIHNRNHSQNPDEKALKSCLRFNNKLQSKTA